MQRASVGIQPARGFTLVELLVVIAIIGILVALLLPAIQASREAGRAQVCRNNLRQLSIAALSHMASRGFFPTGGWGASWTGDPDRGFDAMQPGGWTYNILPFLDESALHDLGAGSDKAGKKAAASQVIQQPMELFHCPSRRPAKLYPHARPYKLANANPMAVVARSDYAINAGDAGTNTNVVIGDQGGPKTLEEGDANYYWDPPPWSFTGISYLRSEARMSQITDGSSHTYLVGEKSIDTRFYESGTQETDRGHLFIGFAPDTLRLTAKPPVQDSDINDKLRFGSAHVGACFFAFCDGSVRAIDYEIDQEVHRQNGNREDGN